MNKPDPIKLTDDEAARIRKLNDQRTSNMAFAEQMRVAGERRNMALIQEGRVLWDELNTKYGLDVQHIQYDLNPDGSNSLVALAAQFHE